MVLRVWYRQVLLFVLDDCTRCVQVLLGSLCLAAPFPSPPSPTLATLHHRDTLELPPAAAGREGTLYGGHIPATVPSPWVLLPEPTGPSRSIALETCS